MLFNVDFVSDFEAGVTDEVTLDLVSVVDLNVILELFPAEVECAFEPLVSRVCLDVVDSFEISDVKAGLVLFHTMVVWDCEGGVTEEVMDVASVVSFNVGLALFSAEV